MREICPQIQEAGDTEKGILCYDGKKDSGAKASEGGNYFSSHFQATAHHCRKSGWELKAELFHRNQRGTLLTSSHSGSLRVLLTQPSTTLDCLPRDSAAHGGLGPHRHAFTEALLSDDASEVKLAIKANQDTPPGPPLYNCLNPVKMPWRGKCSTGMVRTDPR